MVNATNVAGIHDYFAYDNIPANGLNYYRLKMINVDGKFKYSDIARIDLRERSSISVFPNPAKKIISLQGVAGYKRLRITDIYGKTVLQQTIKNDIEPVDIGILPAGVYQVQLSNDKETRLVKVIKQ